MIRTLKKQFVLISMSMIVCILIVVFAAISGTYYHNRKTQAYQVMENTLSAPPGAEHRPRIERENEKRGMRGLPVFITDVDDSGEIIKNPSEHVTMDEDLLKQAVAATLKTNKTKGSLSSLRLLFLKQEYEGWTRIAFADQSDLLSSAYELVRTLIIVGLLTVLLFWRLSVALANWALKPVEDAWKKQRRFLADASHELKTPLTVILTNLGILDANRNSSVESQIKWIDNSRTEALRMQELIGQMLFLAKNEGEIEKKEKSSVNLSEVAVSAILSMESVAYERHLQISQDIAPNLRVNGNAEELDRLIRLLLDNACKYAPEKTEIFAELSAKKNQLVFSLKNTMRTALSEEDLRQLFQRFYRPEKSRAREAGGYGLGLSIAERIVLSHGGQISVRKTDADEIIFSVTLPAEK